MGTEDKHAAEKSLSKCLDELPGEIVLRIAAAGTCSTALALAATNRQLREWCYQPLLFKQIVETSSQEISDELGQWWVRATGNDRSDTSLAAKWALADEMATKALKANVNTFNKESQDWLIPLIVSGHPSRECLLRQFMEEDGTSAESLTKDFTIATFLFACEMSLIPSQMWFERKVGSLRLRVSDHSILVHELFDSPCGIQDPLLEVAGENEPVFVRESESQQNETHSHVLAAIGVLATIYHAAYGCRSEVEEAGGSSWFPPPDALCSPLLSMLPSCSPFMPLSGEKLVSQYVHGMTQPDFLEDGEWVGFYCYSIGVGDDDPAQIDPAMEGIHFQVTQEDASDLLLINGRGRDGVGPFGLRGRCSRRSGRVEMEKNYEATLVRWRWRGAITPFGITGSWESGPAWGGWFWIWKRSWTQSL